MVGQVTTTKSWILTEDESVDEVDFYPAFKLSADVVLEVNLLSTLQNDINSDWRLSTGSWYFNGKAYQKYASLCLMAADSSVVGTDTSYLRICLSKLEKLIEPFLTNTLDSPLAYDTVYKGIVTSQVYKANNIHVEFGNGIYNDHHYHYGYWVTASAILKKLDPTWSGMAQLDTMVWTLIRDVANPSAKDTYFPKFRHFSWYLGHSYSHGVTPMADGKDEESTSEDMNFCYGLKLWGQVSGNKAVEDLGSLMLRLNARTVRTYFLMTSDNTIHPAQFVPNHVTGIFFDNKVDYTTWFSAEKYCIHGIQMIPVLPINGLARTTKFIKEEWDDILSKEAIVTNNDVTNAWLSLLLVNQAVINQADALAGLATAAMDDGLTRSWALYNAASRGGNNTLSSNITTPMHNANSSTPKVIFPVIETPSALPGAISSDSNVSNKTAEMPSNATEPSAPSNATPGSPAATNPSPILSPATPPAATAKPKSATATPCIDRETDVTTSGSWKDLVGQFSH
ncbi:endo--beta [Plasmopara halstedii]|uniref:glucan endo-1,3-beta-D-glucosidase n=1 Tax=Plasmopara halstedii TaxID=4781 RepID=A0A0N7L6H7_PLAHL|nr:endo--beta [Plasmopara halstedii]CEG44307.1 endo--beta [Plasmopara halstedii]|eukprot:XP_024580676.1 endo--beta [Plasmopara halstedii]